MSLWLALQLASCLFMTGLIWVIQLIHYPAFAAIDPTKFRNFHEQHGIALSIIAGPTMVVELLSAGVLALELGSPWILNLVLIATLWIVTFFLIVPLHNRLSLGQDPKLIRQICRYNWIRTGVWSARSVILFSSLV